MSDIIVIFKKEMMRFLNDKRMIASVIMPGILIFVLYSLIGNVMSKKNQSEENSNYQVVITNYSKVLESVFDEISHVNYKEILSDEAEYYKKEIKEGKTQLLIEFSENFDEELSEKIYGKTTQIPEINIYYDSTQTPSMNTYNVIVSVLSGYEESLANIYNINVNDSITYDLATNESMSKKIFSAIIPFFLLTFLINGCMSIASESIAGERERGTMATILVTPVKRFDIVMGKILSLSLIGLISGISVFLGLIFSLPQMAKVVSEDIKLNIGVYMIVDYVILMLIIISTVLLIVSIIAVISAVSNSVRESNMMSTPLMVLSILVSLPSIIGVEPSGNILWYTVPLYNSVECMNAVLTFSLNPICLIVTLVSNLIYMFLFVVILTKMFNNEKIIF